MMAEHSVKDHVGPGGVSQQLYNAGTFFATATGAGVEGGGMSSHVGSVANDHGLAAALAGAGSHVDVSVPVNVLSGAPETSMALSMPLSVLTSTQLAFGQHAIVQQPPVYQPLLQAPVPLAQQLATTPPPPKFNGAINLEEIRQHLENFCNQREWQVFHTPRYLLLDLLKHTGILAEFFQKPGLGDALTPEDRAKLAEKIADCQLSLCRLADVCAVDLGIAIREKLQKNESRYPVERYRGRTDLSHESRSAGGKRKRFTDEQLNALTDLADKANWSLLSVPKEERDRFCRENEITKERLHNFFNNRKPKDLKKARPSMKGEGEESIEDNQQDIHAMC